MDIEIIGSYYGVISRIAEPRFHISVIREDGKIDEGQWREMCRRAANNGATGLREMPFWLEKTSDHIFAPFLFVQGTYDLVRLNPLYFDNLRRLAEIANRFNLKFYFSLYEQSNIRPRNGKREFVPWTQNRQGLANAWYGNDAAQFRINWEQNIFKTFAGLNVGFELCNEPEGDFVPFLLSTLQHTLKAGIPEKDILTGVPFCLDESQNRDYRQFKNKLKATYGDDWYNQQKRTWFTVIHQLSVQDWQELELQIGHTRRFWLSVDGLHPKPGKEWWKKHLSAFLQVVGRIPFKNRYAFETMHKNDEDDFDDVLGIAQAVQEVAGEVPPNYQSFPVEPGEIILPAPAEIIRFNQRLDELQTQLAVAQEQLTQLRRQVDIWANPATV